MGIWGAQIFDDDFACQIKDDYQKIIKSRLSSIDATKKIIELYQEELEDIDESNVFWISLAATQIELGQIQEIVKENALIIIKSGADLERWMENSSLFAERKKALEQLKKLLQS